MRIVVLFSSLIIGIGCASEPDYVPREGDIIFHTSQSSQSQAIQLATHSPYSHMGIVFQKNKRWVVLEAVQPVRFAPLTDWIARGLGGRFVVKRLRNGANRLPSDVLKKMKSVGTAMVGKDYDLYFEWSDDRIYCSELVWKIYDSAVGIRIGELQTISEFDLTHPAVAAKIKERFGGPPPADEIVISPAAILDSSELTTIYSR